MDYFQIILLSIIQGLTEFLPISSSGHLILAPKVFGFPDQGLALDAILHLGTLLAILIFFRKDLVELFLSLFDRGSENPTRRLAWSIILATFPAGIAGLMFADQIEANLRSTTFVSVNLLIWSGVFFLANRRAANRENSDKDYLKMGLGAVLFVGFAQAVALLPGTSRSGITIAAGLFCQLSQTSAARFSFLLGTPIILAAGLHKLVEFQTAPPGHLNFTGAQLGVGFIVSFVVGYAAIQLLLKIVARVGLLPFILYRVLLASAILIFFSDNFF